MELNKQFVSVLAEKLSVEPEEIKKVATSADENEVQSFTEKVEQIHFYNEDDLNSLIKNKKGEGKKEGIIEGKGNAWGIADKRIYELTGVEKLPEEEKDTVAYLKRAFDEKIQKSDPGKKPNEELERLRNTIAEKDQAIQSHLVEIDSLKTESENQKKQFQINSVLSGVINSIPIEADEKLVPAQRDFLRYQFEQKYDVDLVEGQVILRDKLTGQELKDPKTANFRQPEEVIKEFAPSVVKVQEKTVQKGGAGIKSTPIKKNELGSIDFSQFSKAKELGDYLKESGISPLSKEFTETVEKYLKSDYGKQSIGAKPVEN